MEPIDLRQEVARGMWEAREQTMPQRTRMTFDDGSGAALMVTYGMADAAIAIVLERAAKVAEKAAYEWGGDSDDNPAAIASRYLAQDIRALAGEKG
ncbi:hypothetical protein [Qipengyuania sp. MTN3-11]|uniref:hypothetical protein n=1 Tax=Qipengyuania sp. MTN3-11 TaxID=3056557 RepID=UPI0036F1BC06